MIDGGANGGFLSVLFGFVIGLVLGSIIIETLILASTGLLFAGGILIVLISLISLAYITKILLENMNDYQKGCFLNGFLIGFGLSLNQISNARINGELLKPGIDKKTELISQILDWIGLGSLIGGATLPTTNILECGT